MRGDVREDNHLRNRAILMGTLPNYQIKGRGSRKLENARPILLQNSLCVALPSAVAHAHAISSEAKSIKQSDIK